MSKQAPTLDNPEASGENSVAAEIPVGDHTAAENEAAGEDKDEALDCKTDSDIEAVDEALDCKIDSDIEAVDEHCKVDSDNKTVADETSDRAVDSDSTAFDS